MALPKFKGNIPVLDRFPSFRVENSIMLHRLGGFTWALWAGAEMDYRRHGSIKVLQVKNDCGQIQITLPSGEVHNVAISPMSRTIIINGQRHSQPLVRLVQKTQKVLGYSPEWGTALYEAPIDRPPKHPIYAFDQAPMRASAP